MSDKRGFTLVEILVALGIGVIMLAAIYSMVNLSQNTSSGMERRVAAQQDEKTALELMAMEIGMASYNPNFTTGNWVSNTDCATASTNQNYLGIQEATSTSITVEMDINESCTANTTPSCMNNPNKVISYNYDASNLYITRETNCGGAQPFLGDTAASGKTRTVRVINGDAGIYNPVIPVFRYFDGNNTEIAAPVTSSIPKIRRIEITLAVETENPDLNNGQRKRMVYSTSVIVRNHLPAM